MLPTLFRFHQITAMLYLGDSVLRLNVLKQSDIHTWWITISTSLLVTSPSGLPQDTSWAVISMGKYALNMMGCAPTGSRDVAKTLGCSWLVLGTSLRTGSTYSPHIYPEAS